MFKRLVVSTLLTCAIAAPAVAKEKKPVDPNKKICRNVASSASRLGTSVCHTRAEWDAIDEANSVTTTRTMGESRY